MAKRYPVIFESDKNVCGTRDHVYGYASALRTAKAYIARCLKDFSYERPKNFRIYDSWTDVDPETGRAPCVYRED